MSLQNLDEQYTDWTLRDTLTINNDVVVQGDLNTTGFIYNGGIPLDIQDDNNVWTGNNTFTNFQPTFLAPVQDEDMATFDYMATAFANLGVGLLPTNNTWTGQNSMIQLPIITNNATVGTNEAVNKQTVDAYITASTGNLGTVNDWTGDNTFTGKVIVPTPASLNAFGNKKYVDDEITAFNLAGGNIEYVESLITGGTLNVTLDPAIYSNMTVCLISAGGLGAPTGTVSTGNAVKSFGGSGGYTCFKIPAFVGTQVYDLTTAGFSIYRLQDGSALVTTSNGGTGSVTASGSGGGTAGAPSITGIQRVLGSTEPFQNPITDDTITRSYNIGCLNGYGQGGSFRWDTGASVAPTGPYALFIKFRK